MDKIDKLKEAIQLCSTHSDRVEYAFGKIKHLFPLNQKNYQKLSDDELSYFDQLIFRFSKLQDSMGNRLFPTLLSNLEEDIEGIPFIDILTKLEKLKLIEDHKKWVKIREIRNIVTHEYPFNKQDVIEGLNVLSEYVKELLEIWHRLNLYANSKFKL